ncbi:helix-turn-helix domain-containing protein [Gulosibacter sediminis]|uniref:helix-turn-helix domain-containing protein n=1 Tax=Gulosibacter sediminis TaxID=1729695 RepID=UPI0024A87261|nr:helix-turn-helix domain-containing protein [Gulosibacter sediminis]
MTLPQPPVGVLPRATLVMDLLRRGGDAGARLNELVQATGLPQPTVHRLLADLAESGAVARRGQSYVVGERWGEVGLETTIPGCVADRERTRQVLQRAADVVGDTIYLAARTLGGVGYCMRCDGDSPVRVFTVEVGEVKPLASSYAGLALLSGLPTERRNREVEEVVARMPARWGERDPDMVRERLHLLLGQMDERGWCGGVAVVPGVAGAACCVPRGFSIPRVALTISAAEQRMPTERVPEAAEVLLEAAAELAEIGG